MRKIKVVSKKYDGSLRDFYEAYLAAEADEAFFLFLLPGTRYWHGRKAAWMIAPDGLLEIFLKRRYYNVIHIAEQISGVNSMYVNIALPPVWKDHQLEWVDLDLDYRVHLDGSVEQLDADEFVENAHRWQYAPELLAKIKEACQEVEAGLTQQSFPFDHQGALALYRQIRISLLSE